MTEYVRVRQAGTGHELTVPLAHFDATEDGAYKRLDKDAVDAAGDPLPPKYHTTVDDAAANKTTASKAASRPNTAGRQADTKKETD